MASDYTCRSCQAVLSEDDSIGIDPDTISGTAHIQYAVWEASTPTKVDTLTWIISAHSTTGIFEAKQISASIFPNPADNILTVQLAELTDAAITLTDIEGKVVMQKSVLQNQFQMDISSLPQATYLLNIETAKGQFNQIILKQ